MGYGATSSNGAPISTMTASMTNGPRGDISLKDFALIDSIAAFDRERIPERVVHAKGGGAFGYFEVTNTAITQYCKAKMFENTGKTTPVAVRFSTVGGESGSADTARDPRGFAVKFYTEEGNQQTMITETVKIHHEIDHGNLRYFQTKTKNQKQAFFLTAFLFFNFTKSSC